MEAIQQLQQVSFGSIGSRRTSSILELVPQICTTSLLWKPWPKLRCHANGFEKVKGD